MHLTFTKMRNIGAHIGFAGALFTHRPHLEVLSPVIPLFYHSSNINMRALTARSLGATKKAIRALREYYEHDIYDLDNQTPTPTPTCPYPRTYNSLTDPTITHSFEYVDCNSKAEPVLLGNKLIFRGKCGDQDICIKFVRRYSQDAHKACAELGFAPTLRAFSDIAGGWHMVVMDYVGDAYEELDDVWPNLTPEVKEKYTAEVLEKVKSMHAAGYVHGDIRRTNVMVKKNGGEGMLLIDFDWAGIIDATKYPMNVNRRDISRHAQAVDGAVIKVEHDTYMTENLGA